MLKTSQLRIQEFLIQTVSREARGLCGDELQQDSGLGVLCVTCGTVFLKCVLMRQIFPISIQNLILYRTFRL
jgi:hypothetical protein